MFNINDAVEIENIDEVRQTKNVIPATANVLLAISKVIGDTAKDKLSKTLNFTFKLVNGIETQDGIKYKGSLATSFPQRVTYWVSPDKIQARVVGSTKPTTKSWWQNKQYLVEFKQILIACGIDPKLDEFKVDGRLQVDSLISALIGKEVMGNIVQKEEQAFDKSTGEYAGLGTFQNEVKNIRKVQ